ncbi:hypothetical protein IscW_ISCW023365, partial [Ixodes scapularis]
RVEQIQLLARISPANEHSLTARTVKPTPKVCDAAFAPHQPTGKIPNLRTSNAQRYQGPITPACLPSPFEHTNAHTHPPNRCRRPTTIHARQPIHPPDTRKHDNNRNNKQQQPPAETTRFPVRAQHTPQQKPNNNRPSSKTMT